MNDLDDIIDRVLDSLRQKSVDGYELYIDRSAHFEVESKEGKVDTFHASRTSGIALRVLKGHRMGFSYTTSLLLPDSGKEGFSKGIGRMVEDAIASAEATSPDPCYDFAPPFTDSPPRLPIFDESFEGISERAKIEKAILLERAAHSVDPQRLKKVRKATYQDGLSRRTLLNSNGFQFSYEVTVCSVSVTTIAEESGESEAGWDFDYSHFFEVLDVEKAGRTAGTQALERLAGKRIPSGLYPVLLQNSVASEFLSLLSHSFLAEQVEKGKSSLKNRRGDVFFSPHLSIMDDGLLPEGISTTPVDGEGMPSLRTPLVVEGPPEMGISNLFVLPGKLPFSTLLEGLHVGVLVDQVMGLHTVDPISGDFSLGCSGQWIEGGRRIHPVKSIAIAGNLFELFRKVIGVGEDLRFFGSAGSPSLLIEGLNIGGE
jgi:PmbA protein